jgi:hypothetical protein
MPLCRILPIALLVALGSLPAQNRWTPELSLRVQSVGGVIPSSDGSLVAYMQTRHVIEEERSEQVSQVFLAKSDGSSRHQLTFGEKSATAPSFSPDGRFVYFRSARTGHQHLAFRWMEARRSRYHLERSASTPSMTTSDGLCGVDGQPEEARARRGFWV